jgi:hypothetical protein
VRGGTVLVVVVEGVVVVVVGDVVVVVGDVVVVVGDVVVVEGDVVVVVGDVVVVVGDVVVVVVLVTAGGGGGGGTTGGGGTDVVVVDDVDVVDVLDVVDVDVVSADVGGNGASVGDGEPSPSSGGGAPPLCAGGCEADGWSDAESPNSPIDEPRIASVAASATPAATAKARRPRCWDLGIRRKAATSAGHVPAAAIAPPPATPTAPPPATAASTRARSEGGGEIWFTVINVSATATWLSTDARSVGGGVPTESPATASHCWTSSSGFTSLMTRLARS